MMKRIIALLLIAALTLALAACGDSEREKEQSALSEAVQSGQYDATYRVMVGKSDSWTPFNTGGGIDYNWSDVNVISVTGEGETLRFTGLAIGESTLTASQDGISKTALVQVIAAPEDTSPVGLAAWYVDFLIADMEGLSEEEQANYLLSIGDYMALSLASGEYDEDFMAMAQAATMLYPCEYLLNNYAALLMDQEEYEEAALWLEKAVETESNNPMVLTNMAESQYQLGNINTAREYAERAIRAEPSYGLPYLIMTCIHLHDGNGEQAIESLFKSYRNCWTGVSLDLSYSLFIKVTEMSEQGEMILTPAHIELLYEAVSAGSVADGRDIPANQISMPYPVDPANCLIDSKSWSVARTSINEENESQNFEYRDYRGWGANKRDARQAFCLTFLALYYEHQIKQVAEYQAYDDYKESMEQRISERELEMSQAIGAVIEPKYNALGANNPDVMAVLNEMYTMQVEMYVELQKQWELTLVDIALEHKSLYEREMRPLLEEYWLKLNAMLGYVENESVQQGYERRAIYQITKHGIVDPLSYAIYSYDGGTYVDDELNKFRFEENLARGLLGQTESALIEQREAQSEIIRLQAVKNRASIEKDSWSDNVTIRIPVGIDVWVTFGMDNGNLKAGYGAFGHEIIHQWNGDGTRSETILSTTSVLSIEFKGLQTLGNEVKDLYEASQGGFDIHKYLTGKINPVGNIPQFDRTQGEGKTYTFDRDGNEIDVTIIKEESTSVSWGPVGLGQTTTSTRGKRFMSNSVQEKIDVNFGIVTFHR